MSASLARKRAARAAAGIAAELVEMPGETRTAAQAAAAAGCAPDQIVKSLVLAGAGGGLWLFLTAGGNRVDLAAAARLAGVPLAPAAPDILRRVTGFAIGGVAPVGSLSPLPAFIDPRLMDFPLVWAAAGTPRHIFPVAPDLLAAASGARVAPFCQPLSAP